MKIVSIDVAETNLLHLLARVEAGEEIILARGEEPIADLNSSIPCRHKSWKRGSKALSAAAWAAIADARRRACRTHRDDAIGNQASWNCRSASVAGKLPAPCRVRTVIRSTGC
jgi:antitoxin (DNA-binding transcriptional repressor) of toxin-antitoxin stability system